MKRGARRSPAKTGNSLFAPTAVVSGATQTRAKPGAIALRVPLPHDWRDQIPTWRITAMLAKVPQDEYLPEVRRFEQHHIAEGTLSGDWAEMWKAWCRDRLVMQVRAHLDPSVFEAAPEPEITSLGLFD